MTLSIIGAGFGRTGTLSLKFALEQLGVGPCYHMNDVFTHASHAQAWRDAFPAPSNADQASTAHGYRAAVDWPPATSGAHWPTTTRRPGHPHRARPDAWSEGISTTIFPAQRRPLPPPDHPHYAQLVMPRELILHGTFGQIEDKAHVLSIYDAHNAAVQTQLRPTQLSLTSRTARRRCAHFLGVPVPDQAFPRSDSQRDFLDRWS